MCRTWFTPAAPAARTRTHHPLRDERFRHQLRHRFPGRTAGRDGMSKNSSQEFGRVTPHSGLSLGRIILDFMNDKKLFFPTDQGRTRVMRRVAGHADRLRGLCGSGRAAGVFMRRPAFAVQDDYVYYPNYECLLQRQPAPIRLPRRQRLGFAARAARSLGERAAGFTVRENEFSRFPGATPRGGGQSNIQKTGSHPARTRAKTGRTTSATSTETITEDNHTNHNHRLKGILC